MLYPLSYEGWQCGWRCYPGPDRRPLASRTVPVDVGGARRVAVIAGVDVAEARKGFDVVLMEEDRSIVWSTGGLRLEDATRAILEARPAAVCIDSPPAWGASGRSRLAERELARLGISAFATPVDPGEHPFYAWMRAGFALFDALVDAYPRYESGEITGRALEVFPAATAAMLAGHLRPPGVSKNGFRRRVLQDSGVGPTTSLPNIDRVDAALAALTGVVALEGRCCALGAPEEGVIVVPARREDLRRLGAGSG
jgi:predicted nuclease with RNAse H fold